MTAASTLPGTVALAAGLALAAALQPGPLLLFLVSRALGSGFRRTVPACFAPLLSDGPIAVLAVAVVHRFPPFGRHLLQAAGGVLLLYLAFASLRRRAGDPGAAAAEAPRTVLQAAALNLLNPNPYLAWALVLGPAVVAAWQRRPAEAVAFVVVFYGAMVATLVALVALAGTARLLGPEAQQRLVRVSALLLAALGLWLLLVGAWECGAILSGSPRT